MPTCVLVVLVGDQYPLKPLILLALAFFVTSTRHVLVCTNCRFCVLVGRFLQFFRC